MADEQPVEGGLLEEVGINLVVEEAGGFKKDLDSSRAALDEFAKSVGGFNMAATDFNAAMLKVSTTLYTVNQRSGNIGKLTAALTAFTKIPETAAKITGFASGAARELDLVATAMARIATETQKTVSAIKAADLSGAMAETMRKAVREAADQAGSEEKAYFAAAIGKMVSDGMKGVAYEGDGGKFKAMLQKTIAAEIEKFATGGAMSRSLRNLAESVQDAVQYIGPGIASGIARGQGDAVKSTVALAKAVEDALRDTLEIHSPSEAAARIGEQIPLGLDKGMLRGMGGLLATAKGMGLSVMKALNEGVNAATAGGMELRLDPAEADAISSVLALAVKDGVVLGAREGFVSLSRSGMADTLQKMSAAITDEFIDAAAASNPGARLNLGAARQLASRGVGYLSGTQPLSTGRPTTVKPEEFRGVLAGILNAEKMIAQAMETGDRDAVTRASDDRKMGVEAARSFLRSLLTPEMKKKYIFLDTETVGPIGNEPGAPFAPSVVDASVRRLGGEEIAGSRIIPWDKTATVRQWKGESDEDFKSRSAVFGNILKEATESGSSLVKFLQDMAAEVAKTTDEVYLAGQNVKFDVDAIDLSLSKMIDENGALINTSLREIFAQAGVKLLGIIDEEDILSAARGRQYRAKRSEGTLGGTLSETAFYVEGKFPEETHTASADTGTSERIFVSLIEDAVRRLDFTETARSLGNTIRRNLGEFDNPVLEDPFGQKAIAAAPAAQAATAAVGKANAQLAATAATAADANKDAAGATGQVADNSAALSKSTIDLIREYKETRGAVRTYRNRAANPEAAQTLALDTIRAAAGTRGFVPGTGKNVVSMGHGAGYMDFSSPEYQARMRAFTEKGGKVSDLFGDMLGSRSSAQERARLKADVEKRRSEALATYSPITTTMPWQGKVEPKGLLRDEDIDRLNLFVDTAIQEFFKDKLDLEIATAEDFREQLGDKRVAPEFSRFVEGTAFGKGRSTDILRYAKARTSAQAKKEAQINDGTYAWVETEASEEHKRLKEIIARSDTIKIAVNNIVEFDRELTAEYRRKAAEISQIISDGQAAAEAAGETYKRDPELENQLAMYRELGARRDPVSAKRIDELQKKRKEIIDKVTQDASEAVKLAQPQAAENAKNIQLALARYEAASGLDKLGIENEIRDLMAAQATFVDSVAAEATTGLFEATGAGKKLSAAQARLDELAPRWETWTAKERVEAESLIDELARYEALKKRFVLSKQEEIRAFLTGGAEATPQVAAITKQIAEVEKRSIADPVLRATVKSLGRLNNDGVNERMARNAEVRARLLEMVNGSEEGLVELLRAYEQSVAVKTRQQPNDTLRADLLEAAKRGSEGEAKIAEVLRKDMVEFGATMGQLELYRTGASGAGTWGAAQIKRTLWEVVSDRSSPLTKMALEYADVVDEFSAGIAAQKDIVDNIVTKTSRRGKVTREEGSYTDEARAIAGQTQASMQATLNNIPIVIDAISAMVPKELVELREKVEGAGSDILTGKARQMLLDIIDDAINGGGIAAGLTNLRTMAANQVGVSISALRSGSNVVISSEERARMGAQIPGKAGSMHKEKQIPGVRIVPEGPKDVFGRPEPPFHLQEIEEVASSAEMLKGYYLNLQQQQEGMARRIREQLDVWRSIKADPSLEANIPALQGATLDPAAIDAEIDRLALELAETNNKIDKYKDHIKRVNAGVAAANERLGDQTPLMGVAGLRYDDTVAPADRTKYDNEELERKAVAVHRDALFKARAVIEAPIQNIEVYAGTFALAMDEAVRTYFDVVEWNIGRSMAGQAKDLDLPKFAEALRSGDKNERKEARDLFRQAVGEADWSKLRETIGATVPSFISNMEAIVGDVIDRLDATGTGDDASDAKIEQFIADRIQPILLQIGQFSSEFTEAFKGVEINKQSPESLDKLFGVLGKMKEFGFGISRAVGELSSEIATMAPAAQAATQNAQKASAAVGSMDDALRQVAQDLGGAAAPAAQQATSAAKATAAATDGLDDVLRDVTDDLLGAAGSATQATANVAQAAPDAAAATAVAGASGPTLIEYNLPTRDGVKCPCDAAIAKLGDRVVAAIEKLADAGLKASSDKPYEPKYKTKAEEKAAAVDLEGARRDYKGQALDILLKRAGEASADIQRAFELDPEEMARQLSKVEGEVARITGLINERFDKVDTVSGMRQATGRTVAAINSAFKNIDYTEFARSFQNQAGKIAAEIDSLTERSAKNIISFRSGASSAVNRSGAPAAQMATANNEVEKAIVKAENDLRDLFARQGEMSITELRIRRQMIIDEMRATGVQIVDAARSLSVLPELRTDTAITKLDTRMAKALSVLKGRIDSLRLDPAEAAKITKSYDSLLADVAMRVANIEASGVGAGAGGDEGRAALDNEIAKLEAFFAEQSAVILEGGRKAQAAQAATSLTGHPLGRKNTLEGWISDLQQRTAALVSSGVIPPATMQALQAKVATFASDLGSRLQTATADALRVKASGGSSEAQEKIFADLNTQMSNAYDAVSGDVRGAEKSIDSLSSAVQKQTRTLAANDIKLQEMLLHLQQAAPAARGLSDGLLEGMVKGYSIDVGKIITQFQKDFAGASPEAIGVESARVGAMASASYKRVSDAIREAGEDAAYLESATIRLGESGRVAVEKITNATKKAQGEFRKLFGRDRVLEVGSITETGARTEAGALGRAFIGFGGRGEDLVGGLRINQYEAVSKQIRGIEEKLQKDLADLREKALDAASNGNANLVRQYEIQMKRMENATEKSIDAITDKYTQRAAAVDKLLGQIEEYRGIKADPRKWVRERRLQTAKLDDGLAGFFARFGLRMENAQAALGVQFARTAETLRPLRVAISAVLLPFKALYKILSAVTGVFKWLGGGLIKGDKFGVAKREDVSATSKASVDLADDVAERASRKGRAAGKKAGEQMAAGLRDSKGRFVSEADGLGDAGGQSVGKGVSKGLKKTPAGKNLAQEAFGRPSFRDNITQGIGVGIGAGIVGGIVRSIQNMGHNIQFALQNVFRTGFQGIIQKESDKMLMQVQASNEALEKGIQDSGASWEAAGEMADEYYGKIENLAKLTSFGKQPLVELFQSMIIAGGTMEQAMGASGNVAAFLDAKSPGNKQAMKTIGEQMAQMMQLGVLQMQDIKPLMQTGLVPVYEYLAKDLGKLPEYAGMTMDELQNVIIQKLKDGEIASDAAWAAIMNGMVETSKLYAGKAALVLGGMLSTFEDIRLERTTQLLEPLTENLLKPLLEWANELLSSDSVVAKFAEIGERISEVASGITEAAAGAVGFVVGLWQSLPAPVQDTILLLGKVAQAFALLAAAIVATKVAMLLIAPAVAAVSSGLAALGAIKVGLLIGIPVAIGAWIDNLYGFRDAVADAFDFVAERFSELVKFISGGSIFQPIIDTIGGLLGGAGKSIRGSSEWAKENSPAVAPSAPTSLAVKEAEKTGGLIGKAAGEAATVTFDEEFEGIDPRIVENAKKAGKDMASALAQNEAISRGFEPAALGDWRKVEYEQERAAEESKGMFVNLYEEFDAAWGRGYQTIMGWLQNIQTAVSTDFTGWAQGVYDNIRDFFAPAVNFLNQQVLPRVGQFVQGFLDWVLAIPQNLGLIFDVIVEWGMGVVRVFQGMLSGVASMISGFFGMGQDAGSAYTDGMGDASMGGVSEMGGRIADMVEAHSPPKFLPNLDKWGTAAADAYLEGWTQADFSILNDLADSLISALSADEGALDEDEIKRIRSAVAQMVDSAVDLGKVDIDAIMRAGGDWGGRAEQVRRLAEAYANLAIVQHKSAEATSQLEWVNTKYDAMLGPLQRRLEALRKSQEKSTLDEDIAGQQRVIDNIYATDAQREAARLKLEELNLQKQINTLEEEKASQADPLQDIIDSLALQNLEAQRALDLVKERWDIEVGGIGQAVSSAGDMGEALENVAEKAKEAGEETKRAFTIPEFDTVAPAEGLLSGFQQKVSEVAEEVKTKWGEATEVFKKTGETLKTIGDNAGAAVDAFIEGKESGIFVEDSTVLGFFTNLGVAAGTAGTAIGTVASALQGVWGWLNRTWNYGPFADQATTTITGAGGEQMGISVPSDDAQQWSQSAGLVERVQFTLTAIVDAAKVGMTSLETEMKAWTTNFSAWWEADGKVKFGGIQKQVTDFFSGIPAAITAALGISESAAVGDVNGAINDAAAANGSAVGEIAGKFISWLVEGIAGVDWTTLGAAATASVFLVAEKFLVWITSFISSLPLTEMAKPAGEATGKLLAGAIMGGIFGGISMATTAVDGDGGDSNMVTRTVSSLVMMVFNFIWGIIEGFANGIQSKVAEALGVDPEWQAINAGATTGAAAVGDLNKEISKYKIAIQNPEYASALDIDISTASQKLAELKAQVDSVYKGDADTISLYGQEALKSWSLGLTSNNSTEEEKRLGKIIWDNISSGADGKVSLSKFLSALSSYAGTDPAKQEQATLGVALALGINAGMVSEEVMAKVRGGDGYLEALQATIKEQAGIKSPSTLFRDEIGKPLGEGILQGMKESLGMAGGAVGDLSSSVAGGADTAASIVSSAMAAAATALDAAMLTMKEKWNAFKADVVAIHNALWLGVKGESDRGYADQQLSLDTFTASWLSVKLPAFKDAVIDLANQIKDGVIAKMQEMVDGVTAKLEAMIAVITSEENLARAYDAGKAIGDSIVKGIVEGMTSKDAGDALDDVADELIDLIKRLVKEAADSNSPSRLMAREVGLPLTQGVAMGMVSHAADMALLDASKMVVGTTSGYLTRSLPDLPALRNIGSSRLPGISGGENIVMHNEVRREYHLHLTVSPQQAVRAEYNFAVLEAMAS